MGPCCERLERAREQISPSPKERAPLEALNESHTGRPHHRRAPRSRMRRERRPVHQHRRGHRRPAASGNSQTQTSSRPSPTSDTGSLAPKRPSSRQTRFRPPMALAGSRVQGPLRAGSGDAMGPPFARRRRPPCNCDMFGRDETRALLLTIGVLLLRSLKREQAAAGRAGGPALGTGLEPGDHDRNRVRFVSNSVRNAMNTGRPVSVETDGWTSVPNRVPKRTHSIPSENR